MKTVIHRANTRGHANHGWLDSHHTFSFASYRDADRMHFGVLRVLNDDVVSPEMGFGKHPHDNMEIISIPLEGTLTHRDSIGNVHHISKGDVQVMSAGTGIFHSEFNESKDEQTRFLQIWLFPNKRNVEPRYDQKNFPLEERRNQLTQVLSPDKNDNGVWIHQDAWFHLGHFEAGKDTDYKTKKDGNGIYLFVLEGSVTVAGNSLQRRDGMGIWDTNGIYIHADEETEFLLMDIPMNLN